VQTNACGASRDRSADGPLGLHSELDLVFGQPRHRANSATALVAVKPSTTSYARAASSAHSASSSRSALAGGAHAGRDEFGHVAVDDTHAVSMRSAQRPARPGSP